MANVTPYPATENLPKGGLPKGYAKARKHSRLVRFLKIAFPIAALLAIAMFIGVTMLARALPPDVGFAGASISGGKLVMANPHMTGRAGGDKMYSVVASRAVQDLSAQDVVRLEDISAEIEFGKDDSATLEAVSGIYNRVENMLTLDQPFTVVTRSGMKANLRQADINIETSELKSEGRVRIDTDQALISAEKLVISDNGSLITFKDNVDMTIKPQEKKNRKTGRSGD
ncbi:LPS export ABC transporter periplasmic protein LptC [Hoeflea sp. WL0058]|uniref:LPS export ABC transporter periplasmic protein LptC n=1 Tax=Flavimaribacter sediminis TaxID=2865987 RepID=A0AAE2ZNJ0_9HYPH|nr:LPS export ABC transporter periplasmic protein LptC [Flavimaribacter sediminis]MBW8637965.1 LPS export ABC transporter periplasmic protein LptC [Flavimaribacter sediminis]